MAQENRNSDNSTENVVSDYVKSLTNEQKMLVVLKKQLYGGSWQGMLEDLTNRLDGKPYVFKLANRINDDIERIKQMKDAEETLAIDLADYVEFD